MHWKINDEPNMIEEALSSPNKDKWKNALEDKMELMKENQVWKLLELLKGWKSIGNKWVLIVKRKVDGTIETYKARLVAKGYTQKERINYDKTFSPVIRFASIRLILAIVASLDLELHPMDVKIAFLKWRTRRRDLYTTTKWICWKRPRAQSVQVAKIDIWP